MIQDLKESMNRWNSSTTERQKLQHTYLATIVVAILTAGVISLLNAEQGRRLTYIALVAIGAFLANALVWNLLNSVVLSKLTSRTKKK